MKELKIVCRENRQNKTAGEECVAYFRLAKTMQWLHAILNYMQKGSRVYQLMCEMDLLDIIMHSSVLYWSVVTISMIILVGHNGGCLLGER